jgi:hypothetical protein
LSCEVFGCRVKICTLNPGLYGSVVAYVRTVKTASGATAVQIVWSTRRGSRKIEHLGSAHDDSEVEALKAAVRQRLAEGQTTLDLGLATAGVDGDPLEIVSTGSTPLWDSLCAGYQVLGFDPATGDDVVFRDLVLARIIEPTSKADSLRVLAEAGIEPVDYRTVTRRLPKFAKASVRQALSAACAGRAGLGPASLVLYDVSTLYFETDAGDGFREPGFSKERRLEPQITIGLLPTRRGSRWPWRRSRATRPRPRPCCRSSPRSRPPTISPMSSSSPMPA